MADDRFVSCCIIKIENKLTYNLSESVYLLQGENVTGISQGCALRIPGHLFTSLNDFFFQTEILNKGIHPKSMSFKQWPGILQFSPVYHGALSYPY